MIESDSLLVVGWANNWINHPRNMSNTLNQIDLLKQEVRCRGIFHTFREGNHFVDSLAKQGCNRSSPFWAFIWIIVVVFLSFAILFAVLFSGFSIILTFAVKNNVVL